MSEFRKNRSKEREKNISSMQPDESVSAGDGSAPEITGSANTGYVHDEYDDYSPWDN